MPVCCECCVLSGRCLCDELITRPEESYRVWCVVVWDLETSWIRRPWPTGDWKKKEKKKKTIFAVCGFRLCALGKTRFPVQPSSLLSCLITHPCLLEAFCGGKYCLQSRVACAPYASIQDGYRILKTVIWVPQSRGRLDAACMYECIRGRCEACRPPRQAYNLGLTQTHTV